MPTDHQITEHPTPRATRQWGVTATALIVVMLFAWAVWLMVR